jgi:hypothetical protein
VRCIRSELACSYEQKITRSKRIAILRGREPDLNTHDTSLMETAVSNIHHNDEVISSQQRSHYATFASQDVSPPHSSVVDHSFELYRTTSGQTYCSRPADTPPLITPAIATSKDTAWPAGISHNDILRWIDVYFDRLYLTLPVVSRTTLYQDLMLGRHKEDTDFSSMVLSMCALSIIQPVLREEYEFMPARRELATKMLQASLSLREFNFGEAVNVEGAIASFFIFAAFFGLGMHKAAWLRLREAVECCKFLGIHQPQAYHGLDVQIKGQRFRLLLILAVTERGFALQRNHTISITGKHVHGMKEMYLSIAAETLSNTSDIYIHDDKDIIAVQGLLQLMRLFDAIDEQVIPCWNRSCAPTLQVCQKLTINQVEKVYYSVAEALESAGSSPWLDKPQSLNASQWADCFVLQQWLLMRMWVSCLTHELLDSSSELIFMRPSFVLDIAERVASECLALGTDVLEVHGSGMIERIHDIAMGVIMAAQGYDEVVDIQRTQLTLDSYIQLLRQFRDQGRPFITALETAQLSIVGSND